MQAGPTVRRPGAGGRGGLGVKRGLGFKGPGKAPDGVNGNGAESGEKKALKSNADFKAMFLKSGEDGAPGGVNKQG